MNMYIYRCKEQTSGFWAWGRVYIHIYVCHAYIYIYIYIHIYNINIYIYIYRAQPGVSVGGQRHTDTRTTNTKKK